ncbi:caspase family protein [Limnoglobus roseus]|uniref:WD-40 repeat protein, beta transducin-like protein n=1 Tax=Limnoglobus roseus TaxID=2598579 RepID=A0A5C1AMM0_9BACT|nr:caspase family protein [Limnoglobus roseus]QEL20669.1 WD-40 repeat protein, beta transducin-like protein [Limnoglobus roseus]
MGRILMAVCLLAVVGRAEGETQPVMVFDTGGHTNKVVGAFFLKGDKQIVTASSDNTVRVWDIATAKTEHMYRLPIDGKYDGTVQVAAISTDRRFLAVGGNNPFDENPYATIIVYVIDLVEGKIAHTLVKDAPYLRSLSFSPDGQYLAAASCTRGAWFWNLDTRQVTRLTEDRCCNFVKFHPEKFIVVVDGVRRDDQTYATFETYYVPSAKLAAQAQSGKRSTTDAGASNAIWVGNDRLVSGHIGMSLSFWDHAGANYVNVKLPITVPAKVKDDIYPTEVVRSPDGRKLLVAGPADITPNVMLIDTATNKQLAEMTEHLFDVHVADFSSDSSLVVTAGYKTEIYVWQAETGKVVARLRGPGGGFSAGGWSRRGTAFGFGRSMYDSEDPKAALPIEWAFDLPTLTLGLATGENFIRTPRIESPSLRLDRGIAESLRNAFRKSRPIQHPAAGSNPPVNAKPDSQLSGLNDEDILKSFRPAVQLLSDDRAIVVYGGNRMYLCELSTGQIKQMFYGLASTLSDLVASPDGRWILTSSYDQTLRVWRVDAEVPVLSVFVADKEWVAWTPEGYYACSPGGERMAGWQPVGTPGSFGTYNAAVQFNTHFYRPDVIKRTLTEGSAGRAAKKIAEETVAPVPPEFRRAQPPSVSIISPKALTKFSDDTFEVEVLAKPVGDNPITELRLQVNGRSYEGAGRRGTRTYVDPRREEVREKFVIELKPGEYLLKGLAETAGKSQGESTPVKVEVLGLEARKPRLFGVGVGVGTYADRADTASLPHGGRDATALLKTLEAHGKNLFSGVQTKILTDDQATRKNMLEALKWMGKQMTDRDVGVFFFSGHADKDEQELLYLCCHDTRRADLIDAGIPASQVKEHLAKTKGTIILVLDACYAGAIDDAVTKDAGDSVNDRMARQFATTASGLIVLCSCRGKEQSLQDATDGGYFTHALIQGLKGKAKAVDGVVHLPQLFTYADEVVRARSKNRQTPYYRANTGTLPAVALSRP